MAGLKHLKEIPLTKIILAAICLATAAIALLTLIVLFQLPNIEILNTYSPNETTLIFSADGKILARLHQEENRRVVPLSQISPYVKKAVVAVEDNKFYQHQGFDVLGILRATSKNLVYGRIVEGGSTITQQLARNLFLSRKKVITRKLAELVIAIQLEHRYTKDEILELYLNQVYFGHNTYGIESAAYIYFGKSAKDLDLAESALLIGLIRGPEIYSPFHNPKGAKQHQIYALSKMLELGMISSQQANLAALEKMQFNRSNLKRFRENAPYFISYILQTLLKEYGAEVIYQGGLKVYTTLDSNMQNAAENTISKYVSREGKKYYFSQAALVSIDPRTGYIKAMVGGADFNTSKFNRVTQARRQPGSAFKPFVYTAAIEKGLSPDDTVVDAPMYFHVTPSVKHPTGLWAPKNFDRKFHGKVTLRYALEKSLNIPALKLTEQVGVSSVIDIAKRMGIQSPLETGLALSLGVSEVTPLEITSAYGTFANAGIRVPPSAIIKIDNREGTPLYKYTAQEEQVLEPNVAAIMVDMMKGVILRGTGVRANIGRPAGAKTGTTENFRDAWFIGFVPQLVTGVWVGNDNNARMKGVAEVAVCPRIWKEYNQQALANEPVQDFPKPTLNKGKYEQD